jgi:hypothetical protein
MLGVRLVEDVLAFAVIGRPILQDATLGDAVCGANRGIIPEPTGEQSAQWLGQAGTGEAHNLVGEGSRLHSLGESGSPMRREEGPRVS